MEQQYFPIKKIIALVSCLSVREFSNVSLGRWCLLIRVCDNGPTICSHLEIRALLSFSKGSTLSDCITQNTLQKNCIIVCTCNLSFLLFIKNTPISSSSNKLALPHILMEAISYVHTLIPVGLLGIFPSLEGFFLGKD